MSNGTRVFLIVAGIVMLATTVTVVGAGAAVYNSGSIEIEVRQQRGADLSVRVPAAVLRLVLALVPDRAISEARGELRNELPADIRGLDRSLRELRDAPDFTIAEINGQDHHVEVRKTDGEFIVDVTDGPDTFHVSVPVDTFLWLLNRVDRPREGV
ncbi:MAG: hypothetical protein OEV00_14230 [Acidobacteriota bacterium]|nr:hypothetical protein [Acidobacteriota bacterium]MDH3786468.1 hypothetical protein [Acidobacteriota bacterium]